MPLNSQPNRPDFKPYHASRRIFSFRANFCVFPKMAFCPGDQEEEEEAEEAGGDKYCPEEELSGACMENLDMDSNML